MVSSAATLSGEDVSTCRFVGVPARDKEEGEAVNYKGRGQCWDARLQKVIHTLLILSTDNAEAILLVDSNGGKLLSSQDLYLLIS